MNHIPFSSKFNSLIIDHLQTLTSLASWLW